VLDMPDKGGDLFGKCSKKT